MKTTKIKGFRLEHDPEQDWNGIEKGDFSGSFEMAIQTGEIWNNTGSTMAVPADVLQLAEKWFDRIC